MSYFPSLRLGFLVWKTGKSLHPFQAGLAACDVPVSPAGTGAPSSDPEVSSVHTGAPPLTPRSDRFTREPLL